MNHPDGIDDREITNLQTEQRALARVIVRCIGILVVHWDKQNLAHDHPYRVVASMLAGYLRRRYQV